MMNEIANGLLYVVFSLLVGYSILLVIPEGKRPKIYVSKKVLITLVLSLPVLALVPILMVSYQISINYESPFFTTLQGVIINYKIGNSWIFTLGASLVLLFIIIQKNINKWLFFLFIILAVFTVSWASHSASLAPITGYLSNSFHFLAAVSWIGVLLIVSFFSRDEDQWLPFIRWFSPFAIISVIVLIATGFMMMSFIVYDYVNSWVLTYGQMLLLKHIVFIPLLLFGFSHGFLLRRRLEKRKSILRKSLRVEAALGLSVFVFTALMTESTPPHEVSRSLVQAGVSPLARLFIEPEVATFAGLVISWGGYVWAGILIAIVLSFLLTFTIMKSLNVFLALIISVVLIITGYLTLMMNVGEKEVFYGNIENAIQSNYDVSDVINILTEQSYEEDKVAVLYEVNKELLSTALVLKTDNQTYSLLPSTILTVGGGRIDAENHKIRTFIQREGEWKKQDNAIIYVTVGYINEPSDVDKVTIHYEGQTSEEVVENNGFLNVISSDREYRPILPIDFYDRDHNIIGGFLRQGVEEEKYCH